MGVNPKHCGNAVYVCYTVHHALARENHTSCKTWAVLWWGVDGTTGGVEDEQTHDEEWEEDSWFNKFLS